MSSVIFSGSSLSQPLAKLSEEVIRWCPIEKFVLPSRPVKSVIWFHVKSILMSLLTSLNFSREVILSPDKSKSVSPPKEVGSDASLSRFVKLFLLPIPPG